MSYISENSIIKYASKICEVQSRIMKTGLNFKFNLIAEGTLYPKISIDIVYEYNSNLTLIWNFTTSIDNTNGIKSLRGNFVLSTIKYRNNEYSNICTVHGQQRMYFNLNIPFSFVEYDNIEKEMKRIAYIVANDTNSKNKYSRLWSVVDKLTNILEDNYFDITEKTFIFDNVLDAYIKRGIVKL